MRGKYKDVFRPRLASNEIIVEKAGDVQQRHEVETVTLEHVTLASL
jgi:hypothetical protein